MSLRYVPIDSKVMIIHIVKQTCTVCLGVAIHRFELDSPARFVHVAESLSTWVFYISYYWTIHLSLKPWPSARNWCVYWSFNQLASWLMYSCRFHCAYYCMYSWSKVARVFHEPIYAFMLLLQTKLWVNLSRSCFSSLGAIASLKLETALCARSYTRLGSVIAML